MSLKTFAAIDVGSYELSMKIFAFSYLVGWVDTCFSSFLTALEQPARSLIVSLFGSFIFPVLFLCILTQAWELNGVWLTPTVAGLASAVLTFVLVCTISKTPPAETSRGSS